MVRTLLDRCVQMVTEEHDHQAEGTHIQEALSRCGYPEWTIKRVKSNMEVHKEKGKKKKKPKPKSVHHKTSVVSPYIEWVSEAVVPVYKRHGISTAMRPYLTIGNLLVQLHQKDKVRQKTQ